MQLLVIIFKVLLTVKGVFWVYVFVFNLRQWDKWQQQDIIHYYLMDHGRCIMK